MDKKRTFAAAWAATAILAGCATGANRTPGDPLEPVNRAIFRVNDVIDKNVAVPVAKGYQKVTPHPLRTAISNFFSNIGDISNVANELLQLKITDATSDLMRVTMNTVFGIGGLIDFATLAKLPKHHQDFGLTLGRWGVPAGPYIVLPLFGPSTARDSVGLAVDVRFNPLNYVVDPATRTQLYILQFVSVRSDLLGATNILEQAALDKYSFVRDAYLQQRKSRLGQGGGGEGQPALPNYGDEDTSTAAPAAPSGASAAAPAEPAMTTPSAPAVPTAPVPAPAPAAPSATPTPTAPTAPAKSATPASATTGK
jgi:phospholipid-binding lipoprotein MlaA